VETDNRQGFTLSLPLSLQGGGWKGLVLRLAAAGLVLAGVGVAVVQANIRPLAADVMARTADRRAATGDWPGAVSAWERATALWPAEPAYRLGLSWAYLQLAQDGAGDPLPWLQRAEAELLASLDVRPGDFALWAALGELYGVWGNRWDAAKLPLADDAYREATALAPNHAMLYTAWGMVYQDGGQFVQAAAKFQQAVDLDATDGYAFGHLGDAELALGQVEEALEACRQAVHWEPTLVPAYVGLAASYWQLGQPDAAAQALRQALQIDPNDPAARALQEQMGLKP
jgi:tetratricopeptide (TPR) repeat protein